MLDLNKILEEWKKDSNIDEFKLVESQRKVPNLHSKYLTYLSQSKCDLIKCEADHKVMLKDKWLYYSGKMDKDRMDELGWEPDPFNGLTLTKSEKEHYYNSDPDIKSGEEKIKYLGVLIDTLKEMVDNLKWRHQSIKNIIEIRKFESGA